MSPVDAAAVTFGVEEEFHVTDPRTGRLRADADRVLAATRHDRVEGEVEGELQQSMVETATPPCTELGAARDHLLRLRREVAAAAADVGRVVVAAGTLPTALPQDQRITPDDRYESIQQLYAQVARDQLVCGLHVHVAVADRDRAVVAMNHVRAWLPVLRALSCSSPFWARRDTGYASYRSLVWRRWPLSMVPGTFESAAEYDALLDWLVETGTLLDRGMAYFDVRPSEQQPTVELRVADTCTRVDEAVLQAALGRALVITGLRAADRGEQPLAPRPEQLHAATWQAARFGISGTLIEPGAGDARPAAEVVDALVAHVRPALSEAGDDEAVGELLDRLKADGTSAERQRRAHADGGVEDVVAHLVAETAA